MLITAADTAGTKFTKNDSTLSQKNQFSEIYVTRNKAEKLDISFSSTFRDISRKFGFLFEQCKNTYGGNMSLGFADTAGACCTKVSHLTNNLFSIICISSLFYDF